MRSFTTSAAKMAFLSSLFSLTLGDPNDWVSVEYVVMKGQPRGAGKSMTSDAESGIVRNADNSASDGPWSIMNSKDVVPPSKDVHDYLSWAPYHWPDCNWCSSGRTHLAHTVGGSNNGTNDDLDNDPPDSSDTDYTEDEQVQRIMSLLDTPLFNAPRQVNEDDHTSNAAPIMTNLPSDLVSSLVLPASTPAPETPSAVDSTGSQASSTPTPDGRSPGPAQAAAKTTPSPSCTPSPTKSLAPSATWTTCPYVVRDGQVNPDVRTLHGPDAINDLSQAVILNAVAYALQKKASYSKNIATFIDTFFISAKMNPNLNFGQIVRGPGKQGQQGTFTGVIDLRGLVKIVNGISIIKAAGSPDWTKKRDDAMSSWLSDYSKWLGSSDIGKKAAGSPNNHGTFFVNQIASAQILARNTDGAKASLKKFFDGQFQDQVAKSGEQPFEAVRTRPYHYRCFNLEGLITNAKLGDQLGLNLWTAKSKYGATIQTALDFILKTNPGSEDINQVLPHVAAISAAYGDSDGKYAAFLKKHEPSYQSKSYYFYDQSAALPNAPRSSKKSARSIRWRREDSPTSTEGKIPAADPVPFACPSIFDVTKRVEIEDGLFVTCDELRPFYEAVPSKLDM